MATHLILPRRARIGVPPGVGDVYWALCKLQSIREKHRLEDVELVIKSSNFDRAGEWAGMCPFVDSTSFAKFKNLDAEKIGLGGVTYPGGDINGNRPPTIDAVLWPNAVVDRGDHLRHWLPEYDLRQDWKIATKQPEGLESVDGHPVIYASSATIHKAWAPKLDVAWWTVMAETLAMRFGRKPIVIGASWDVGFSGGVLADNTIDMLGKTTLAEVAWILEHAAGIVGIISGMTILANHFRTPAIAIYPPKHHDRFPEAWMPEDAAFMNIRSDRVMSTPSIANELASMSW